jgi:hypothetical protein
MGLSVESLMDKVIEPFFPLRSIRKKGEPSSPVFTDALRSDTSAETRMLLSLIARKAYATAYNVRQTGEQPHGPMWAQGYVELSDGRTALLQQQQDELYRGETLEIAIDPSSDSPYHVHVRYNLRPEYNFINTFEVWRKNHTPVIVYDRMNARRLDPACLRLCDIVHPVSKILEMVHSASENIEWKKPAFVPEFSPTRISGVLQAGQVITLQ